MLDIKITRTTSPKEKPDENNLGFGKKFTDHMFVMDYTEGEGWHDDRIVPYGPFELDPATVVFHYAQEIFEGMKAYRTADDTVQLFRPDCNAKRFQDSADRLCIPKIPVEDYIQAVETLVDVDRDWVPHSDGASLYIRPFVFANDVGLGVHASKHYIFCIIAAPSGAYYAEGINPVRIYVEDEYIRAAPGLTGFTKCGAVSPTDDKNTADAISSRWSSFSNICFPKGSFRIFCAARCARWTRWKRLFLRLQ